MSDTPAEEATSLEEARRIIAELRSRIVELEQQIPGDDELSVHVTDEDSQRIQKLYADNKLTYEQAEDPDMELDEALQYFLSNAIGVTWDLTYSTPKYIVRKRPVPPSA